MHSGNGLHVIWTPELVAKCEADLQAAARAADDVIEAVEKKKNPWERWFERIGSYCERHFGPDWQKGDKIFWDKFPFY
mgnify:CR=1 FL=1